MSLKLRSLIPYGNYDSLVAAIAGFLLIQACAWHGGIGISPDSVVYMSTAANIHDHGAINDFTGFPMMDFPAGYPVFLSLVQFLTGGLKVLQFGPVLNGLLFGSLIFLCGWLMERFTVRSRIYKWILLSIIVLSPCLLEVYCMIWSETLFLLLIILFIINAHRYFRAPSIKTLLPIAIIAALACVTRYAGISLILAGGLLIFCDFTINWKKKVGHLLLFGLIASSLFVLNVYRNHLVTGTLTGYREKATTSLGTNLKDFGSVLCDWLPFFNEDYRLAGLVGSCCILFCTGLFLYRLIRKKDFYSYENIGLSFFVVYAIFILATASLSRFQQLDSRLLSPLFICWLWGSTSWIPGVIRNWKIGPPNTRWRTYSLRIFFVLCLAAAVCFQVGQWEVNAYNWDGVKYAGIPGYTEDQWKTSETIRYMRAHKDTFTSGTHLFSNAFEGIWFLADIQSDMLPHKDLPWDVTEFLKEDHFYVVWFDDAINTDLVTIEFITQKKKLVSEQRFHDGTIYYFTAR